MERTFQPDRSWKGLGYIVLSVVFNLPQAISWPPTMQQKLDVAPQATCQPRPPGGPTHECM